MIICLLGIAYIAVTVAADLKHYANDKVADSIKLALIIILCIVGFFSARDFFHFTHTTPVFLIAMCLLIVLHIVELTEEFAILRPVPLFGEDTLAKRAFQTTLITGSICCFLGGMYLSVFKINKVRRQLDTDVNKLAKDRAQLKSLASQLSLTEERERHRLATELHDQIGQSLVFCKLKLDQLRISAASSDITEALEGACKSLERVIQDTRTLTFDLSSPILYEFGFEAAVAEWLNDEIREKYGIETELKEDGLHKPLGDDIRVVLFRNVRELLINVVKHAQAKNVKVSIRRDNGDMHVTVEDDGVGFDTVEAKSMAAQRAEFGLFSIQERLEQLGGHVEINSEPGRGSRITMIAPLAPAGTSADSRSS